MRTNKVRNTEIASCLLKELASYFLFVIAALGILVAAAGLILLISPLSVLCIPAYVYFRWGAAKFELEIEKAYAERRNKAEAVVVKHP